MIDESNLHISNINLKHEIVLNYAMRPYISVIITDFNRKDFVIDAVRSAINQTLDKSFYEVIVVKNYIDDKIDNILKKLGVKILHSKEEMQGKMVYDAITVAEGDVLSFLDDDDKFLPNKLERVFSFFTKYDDIDYYKNLRIFIDKNENFIKKEVMHNKLLFVENNEICEKIDMLIRNGIMVNSSTISIRKEIIEKEKELLKKLPLGVDSYFFVTFAIHGRRLIIDDNHLTLFRVHESQSFIDRSSFEKFAIKRLESAKKFIIAYSIILETLKEKIGTNNCILKYIKSLLLRSEVVYNIYSSVLGYDPLYKLRSSDLIHLIKYPALNSYNMFDYLKLYAFMLLNYFPKPIKYIGARLEYKLNKNS